MNTITSPFKRSFIFTLLALFLTGAGWLQAGPAGIQDDGGFFSGPAKADAQGNITLAQRTLHKDIRIDTFLTLPDDVKKGLNLQDKAAVNRAYEQWVNKRAESLGVDGVYVLIVKDPPHIQAGVGNDTQKQAFTLSDRDSLVKLMADKLRAKDYDAALRQGVAFVVSTMKQHSPGHARNYGTTAGATATNTNNNLPWNNGAAHKTAPAEKSGFPWGWVIALIVIFLVIRVIGSVLGAIFRGGNSGGGMPMGGGGYGGYPQGGGGGGFMRSLMGGVLGAAAGSWMYDNFFGSHGSSAYGAPPPDGGQDGGYTGHDTSFSSSGSDYGDSGGGGGSSWDSGSSGGGSDFGGGGGDFGGGGDSGGGGGSDF